MGLTEPLLFFSNNYFPQNNSNNLFNYVCVYIYIHIHIHMFLNVHLNISEMYDNNDVSNGKEKLGFFFSITRYSHYP